MRTLHSASDTSSYKQVPKLGSNSSRLHGCGRCTNPLGYQAIVGINAIVNLLGVIGGAGWNVCCGQHSLIAGRWGRVVNADLHPGLPAYGHCVLAAECTTAYPYNGLFKVSVGVPDDVTGPGRYRSVSRNEQILADSCGCCHATRLN